MFVAALGVACAVLALVAHGHVHGQVASSVEEVSSGRCAPCLFEERDIGVDGIWTRVTVSEPVYTKSQQRRLQGTDLFGDLSDELYIRELESAAFIRDGLVLSSAPDAVREYNRCGLDRSALSCPKAATLPVEVGRGGVLVIVFSTRTKAGFGGGNYSTYGRIPKGLSGNRFGAIVRSAEDLSVEGDLVPGNSPGTWRFKDSGLRYYVASTASSWNDVARAFSEREELLLADAEDALLGVPLLPPSASEEMRLQAHWMWIRKNFSYRYSPTLWDDSVKRSGIDELLQQGAGDCKDFVLLLQALLRRDGIRSDSVWVDTTREAGERTTKLPTNRTDHVILYIPSLDLYVDPTLANKQPFPTARAISYDFAVNTRTGEVLAIDQPATH
jgi:hypothetical protein